VPVVDIVPVLLVEPETPDCMVLVVPEVELDPFELAP
jgi:hypothetical protein